ncbi:MAG: 2-oxo acid dehydrogenase subunit E2 [Proteobacteria bacterium]|nr:2-oxo acid dehydrogenase subunit E2 [Pseudomonadota bacterium]
MTIFKLPDLGEGLPDAEIHEWYVKEGDVVKTDQPLVSMETAKAVVDVPAPQDGKITKLYGNPGDIIKTGSPLIEFEIVKGSEPVRNDTGTVVGNIEVGHKPLAEKHSTTSSGARITPAIRALATKLKIDLASVKPTGPDGLITKADLENATQQTKTETANSENIRGTRRVMVSAMANAHAQIVPVTIYDDADIHAWKDNHDFTVRLVKAITEACKAEPTLNAWFDGQHLTRTLHSHINLGLAVDTSDGLFVPVIHEADKLSPKELRASIESIKEKVQSRTIPPEDLKGATITLSNFGKFAGRYASPIIVPPTVAIIAAGRIREDVVAYQGQIVIHRVIPLSVTFDHRTVTGGEATRFLGTMIEALEKE